MRRVLLRARVYFTSLVVGRPGRQIGLPRNAFAFAGLHRRLGAGNLLEGEQRLLLQLIGAVGLREKEPLRCIRHLYPA